MSGKKVKVFAPSSVSNVGPGYDILGYALHGIGDTLTMEETEDEEFVIKSIVGAEGIPTDPASNVSTVALASMLREMGIKRGFELSIEKNITPGSGLGSSASGAAAAVMAGNELLGRPFSKMELVRFAMEGEAYVSGKPHADNVAPSLLGGFTVVRSYHPLDIIKIDYPEDLHTLIIFPALEVKTADAKRMLKKSVDMDKAITQWGNVAGLIAGLTMRDFELIGRSLQDVIIEPVRSLLLPYYDEVKELCLQNGALGFNISGSGPSMFALTKGQPAAERIKLVVGNFYEQAGLEVQLFVSSINNEGAVVKALGDEVF